MQIGMLNQARQYLLTPYKSRSKPGLERACNVLYGKTNTTRMKITIEAAINHLTRYPS